jgi:hypothetical protein
VRVWDGCRAWAGLRKKEDGSGPKHSACFAINSNFQIDTNLAQPKDGLPKFKKKSNKIWTCRKLNKE